MQSLKSFALATVVTVAVTGALAGPSFSGSDDRDPSAAEVARTEARERRAEALSKAVDGARQARERAEVANFLTAVELAEQQKADEAARQARLEESRRQQRASRSAVQAPAGGNWSHLINQYPWPTQTAYRIMMCESGGDPNAYNARSGATGLFQILDGPRDPAENVALAFRMWQSRGWQPWRQCL